MQENNTITAKQMALLTFFTQTGVGIIILPALLAKKAGHDGWISVLLTGLISILLSLIILKLLGRYANKTIYEINKLLFGKYIGFVFNIVIVIYLLLTTIWGIRLFGSFMRITLLPQTPPWVLTPFIMLPSFYLVWQGLKVVSRFKNLSLFFYSFVIIYMALLIKEYRFSFLLPIGEAGAAAIFSGIRTSFFAFVGLELIIFFYSDISDKKETVKWQIIANLCSMLFFIINIAATTSLFGENFLRIQTLSFYNFARVYNAPILERLDIYIIAIWFIPMACSMRAHIIATYYSIRKVFSIRKTKFSYVLFFIAILLFSRIPKDINETLKLHNIVNDMAIGLCIFLILCFFLSYIRKKGVKTR